MILFPAEKIVINYTKTDKTESILKSVLRQVIYSRTHIADDVLENYLTSILSLG